MLSNPLPSEPSLAEREIQAVIYYLSAFGYVDGNFDLSERRYVVGFIDRLVRVRLSTLSVNLEPSLIEETHRQWTQHFLEFLSQVDEEIQAHLAEPTADGESSRGYALSRLKLRCFETFRHFDVEARRTLLRCADELVAADGQVAPEERQFLEEMARLIDAPEELSDAEITEITEGELVIGAARMVGFRSDNHPFFTSTEWRYSTEKSVFAEQAERDIRVLREARTLLERGRVAGQGTLATRASLADFAGQPSFTDGHVIVSPASEKDHELLVLGDLHGCYSCLKAALLQADFFAKVQRYHDNPDRNPNMQLVLLGDYIDRGKFSYNGILRTVLSLYLRAPEHVIPLRGNHEYYVELNGRVYGAVKPSEAMTDLKDIASNDLFGEYRLLFESLPNFFVFDDLFFVHGGIPRDETVRTKWSGLQSLNDPELRFEMLWSDPSNSDIVPDELQKQSARFGFGRQQFRTFMRKLGCTTMIRGHEKIDEGFREVYGASDARLLTVFSSGGANNRDLPEDSSYRDVRPMALTIKRSAQVTELTPFEIEYERFNRPEYNAFFSD